MLSNVVCIVGGRSGAGYGRLFDLICVKQVPSTACAILPPVPSGRFTTLQVSVCCANLPQIQTTCV